MRGATRDVPGDPTREGPVEETTPCERNEHPVTHHIGAHVCPSAIWVRVRNLFPVIPIEMDASPEAQQALLREAWTVGRKNYLPA